jgi:parallel beta-helix repeat protein
VNDVIHLHNQQYWEISNLDISNLVEGFTNPMARTDAQGTLIDNKDLRGIRISGNNGETLSNFHLHDLNIHDVTGQIWWIGGSASSSGPGFRLATGWDASKRTGAILVEGLDGDNPTIFTNVTVENNVFERNSFGAFTTKQFLGTKIWATPSANSYPYNDPNFKPHTNITVRGNYIDQSGWYHGDGIYLTSVRGALVENNVVKDPGVCGIEMYWSDSITVQYNEVYGSTSKGGGGDTNGIDPDIRTSNIIVQYNYIHDNGDGILVCGNNYNTVIIRYNVLYNNKTRWIRDVVSGGFIQVYNNVMYNTTSQSTAGTITFTGQSTTGNDIWEYRNNVFYNAHAGTTNGSFVAGTTYSYSDNLYYGITAPASHANATVGDPVFTGIPEFLTGTSVATRFHDFSLLKPTTGSPLINRGVAYSAPENPKRIDAVPNGLDYAGVAVGTTDIGLYAANFNGLSGIVTSMLDNSIVAGATVTLTPSGGGTGQTSTTNESGKYSFAVVNPGSYVIKVAVTNFLDSETPFEANVDSVSWLPLKTGGFVGLSGFVKNEFEEIISGATVTLTPSGGGNPMTATSDASGMYSFVTVNSGTYTIKVSATGYEDSEITRAIDSATSPLTLYTGAFSAIYKRTVTGTITTTSSGGPLSGATVAISKNGVSMGSATTNANGEYTLANIPIGAGYTISAEKSGYNTKTRLKLVVTDDPQTVVDFILRDDQSIEENFEKTSLTSMKWTLRSGNGIQGSNTGGMSQTLVEDPVDSTNSAGEYLGNGNGPRGTQLNLTRPIIGDTVYVEFDWYIGRPLGSYGQLSIQDGTTANFPSTASNAVFDNKFITFAASSNNSFYYRLGNFTDSVNPTTNGGVALTGFTAAVLNSWVNVKVSIDFQASTISFEIRKKSDNSVLASETALPFATGITYNSKVESLRFLARQPGTNGWRTYLDNLYIGLIP